MKPPLAFRHVLAGSMLLAAVVARIVSIFLWPSGSDGSRGSELAAAASHPAVWFAATWVEAVGWLLAVPAVLVLVGRVRGRGGSLVLIGGGVLVLGYAMLGCATSALNAVTGVLASQSDRAAALDTLTTLHASPALLAPVFAIELGMLGAVVLAVGLALTRAANWALPAIALLIIIGSVVTSDSDDHLLILVGFLPVAALWLWIAAIVFRVGRRAPVTALAPRDVDFRAQAHDL